MKQNLVMGTCLISCILTAQDRGTRNVPGNGVIDMPGEYVLVNDASLRSHGAAILVTASNVTLNLNGRNIVGPGGRNGAGILIRGVNGVNVFNGFVTNHAFGVIIENCTNVRLTDLQIRGEGLAVAAPPPETGIMIVQSRNVVIEHNAIYNTGLGIFVRGSRSWGNRIANNTLTGGTNALLGICYNPAETDPNGPRGDLVHANLVSGFNVGVQMSQTSPANVIKGNTIAFRITAIDLHNMTNLDVENAKIQLP